MITEKDASILIVEDDKGFIYILKNILQSEGYQITTASLAEEAIKILENKPVDVILLDHMLPGISGVDFLLKIKADEQLKDIPVVMISVLKEAKDAHKALELGAIDYIRKPVEEIELKARIKTALRIKRQQDELKNLLDFKTNIIGIVSHDLRTPFTNVLGYVKLLQMTENLTDKGKEYLNRIIITTDRVIEYSNRLLNMAFLESGKMKLNIEKYQLLTILNEAVEAFSVSFEVKNISIEINVPPDLAVFVDLSLFHQVITNLLSNAVKFTRPGGQIIITSERSEEAIILKILDTGVGMEEETKEQLFEAFLASRTHGTSGETGSGLGLSICKKILQEHDFDIEVSSEKDRGTEFKIIMPVT